MPVPHCEPARDVDTLSAAARTLIWTCPRRGSWGRPYEVRTPRGTKEKDFAGSAAWYRNQSRRAVGVGMPRFHRNSTVEFCVECSRRRCAISAPCYFSWCRRCSQGPVCLWCASCCVTCHAMCCAVSHSVLCCTVCRVPNSLWAIVCDRSLRTLATILCCPVSTVLHRPSWSPLLPE